MISKEVTINKSLLEEQITFKECVEIILEKLNNAKIKTVFEIPNTKGMALHQVTEWEYDDNGTYDISEFNGNLVIRGKKQSIAINDAANIILRDRKPYFEIYFKDYNLSIIIMRA